MPAELQSSKLPPAQPSYVFRGHVAQVHSVQIVRRNTRLLTGDADGWIVVWKLESKRPVAVWHAHDGPILGTAEWGLDKVATHGRDNSFKIWKLGANDEANLSTVLPVENSTIHRPRPWLLHSLAVNTLNFCPFSMCREAPAEDRPRSDAIRLVSRQGHVRPSAPSSPSTSLSDSILVAVPAPDDKKIDIHQFPSEKLVYRVPKLQPVDSGMVMAIKLVQHPSNHLLVIAGYESGFTAVHLLDRASGLGSQSTANTIPESARTIYLSQPHSQPIMSLDAAPDGKTYFTSAADAIIAAHRIPEPLNIEPVESPKSGNAAQVDEVVTSKTQQVPATIPSPSEPSIDKSPSTPLTFSKQHLPASSSVPKIPSSNSSSLLSAALSSSAPQQKSVETPIDPFPSVSEPQAPIKSVNTKHAGQQSLRVRSDGRILATGGWDSRIRVYSARSLKEVAVLKWHKEGVYAVGFGEMLDAGSSEVLPSAGQTVSSEEDDIAAEQEQTLTQLNPALQPRGEAMLSKLQRQREEKMQRKHWIAAGAKDGKVSLWEIY